MSLEVNKTDTSLDTKQIPTARKIFTRSIAGLLTTLVLCSGSIVGPTIVEAKTTNKTTTEQSTDDISPDTVIEIPESYQYTVASMCGKEKGDPITVADLNKVNKAYESIAIYDDSSLEWLNYVGNIDCLSLILHMEDDTVLKDIKKINVRLLSISPPFFSAREINLKDFAFIKNSKSMEELHVSGLIMIEPGFLEQLTNLKKISLYLQDGNYDFDYSKLGFLDELYIKEPYSAAIYLTQKEYDSLKKEGVKVTFDESEDSQVFKEINRKLDAIVDSLDISKKSSDQEKLDAILCYVLDNLEYDEEVSNAIQNNIEHDNLSRSFYTDGLLYGALEKDTAICGNYSALTNALAERIGLDTYYLVSHDHAWSLVEVEGKQYYVDSTWLDSQRLTEQKSIGKEYDQFGNLISEEISFETIDPADAIRKGRAEELEWYMENPSSYPKSNNQAESHIVINLPSYFGLNPQEEKEGQNIQENQQEDVVTNEDNPISLDGKKVELRFGKKAWIISGAAAIGVLSAIGGAVAVNNKKKKERERRRRQSMYDYLDDYSTSYGSSYGSSFNDPLDDFFDSPSTPKSNRGRRRR